MGTLTMKEYGQRLRKSYRGPLLATDIIIECDDPLQGDGIVLIRRRNPPYGLALPGGLAEAGLSLPANAIKEAREETGLEVTLYAQPLCIHSYPQRDPREHIVSIAYVGRARGTPHAGDDAKTVELYPTHALYALFRNEKFAFADHKNILEKYLETYQYSMVKEIVDAVMSKEYPPKRWYEKNTSKE